MQPVRLHLGLVLSLITVFYSQKAQKIIGVGVTQRLKPADYIGFKLM